MAEVVAYLPIRFVFSFSKYLTLLVRSLTYPALRNPPLFLVVVNWEQVS